jgi:hypothetical protein
MTLWKKGEPLSRNGRKQQFVKEMESSFAEWLALGLTLSANVSVQKIYIKR